MDLLSIIVPVIVSALLTALMVPLIIRLSLKKKLCDTVDERTVHSGEVPRLGGSAFILSVRLWMMAYLKTREQTVRMSFRVLLPFGQSLMHC